MSLAETLAFAVRALTGHWLRTLLSLVGMCIGVAAVVALVALGNGARDYVSGQFASLGSHLVIVVPGRTETTGIVPTLSGVPNDLTLADAEALHRGIPEVVRMAPVVTASDQVSHGERRRNVSIFGTTADFIAVQDFDVGRGRFLPPGDVERGSPVAVLGSKTARELFPSADPIGQRIRIGDRRARVIGVLAERGVQVGINLDEVVIIPVRTAMQLFNRSSLFRVILQARPQADLESVRKQVLAIVIDRHGEEDVTCLTQDSVLQTLGSILDALTYALVAIAAISLSVAGIGIMNVMLVSVAERTAEIGLLKAIGAERRQILGVFLAEAAVLATCGGVLGVLVGWGAVRVLVMIYPTFPAAPPAWAIAAALFVALFAGLVFGVLPARRATRLDPVQALARR